MAPLSLDTIRAALACLPADLPRDEWARVAMALKSELGEAGFDLFDAWSQTGEAYDAKAAQQTWRSVSASGGVGIGTLIRMAQLQGFTLPDSAPTAGRRELPSPVHKAQRDEAAEQARQAGQQSAAAEAGRLWSGASESGTSPYLLRKKVAGHGVRYGSDGWLYVPLRDAGGTLWNLQRISPDLQDGGSKKLYLKGGRKSGLWHWCGTPADGATLLIAEGYATAASLFEATGLPVAVAFDAGNLVNVAQAIRQAYPGARIVICADDDQETEKRTGSNPGLDKARAAAEIIGAELARPCGLANGGSDFNDLAVHRGVSAVRDCVEAALSGCAPTVDPVRTGAPVRRAPLPVRTGRLEFQTPESKSADSSLPVTYGDGVSPNHVAAGGDDPGAGRMPPSSDSGRRAGGIDRFSVDEEGVWYQEHDSEGRPRAPLWICSPLQVTAQTRDGDGQGWGVLLEFSDGAGHLRRWAMPMRMLAGDGTEFRATLMDMGLRIAAGSKARNLLAHYIQTRQVDNLVRCTDRIGWHGSVFVLPGETLGDADERIVHQAEGRTETGFSERGTLKGWRDWVAAACVGNSRLGFAVSAAFAGPLLRLVNIDSGGFHLRGESSSGKTTALRVAGSVYGGPGFMQRWRATDNALESIAAQHSDGLLILDELAQVDPKTAGECAYMLANEQSKARSTRTGQPRQRLTWRLLFLSAGEISLSAHMAEGGKRARVGQETRMADIPADAGAGLGVFEDLHGCEHGGAMANALGKACDAQHGTAGRDWLEWIVVHFDDLSRRARVEIEQLAQTWTSADSSGQVHRVARRFAAVATAGELATEAGLTGWPKGEAMRAAKACYDAWLSERGGDGNAEAGQMQAQVRRFFETHGEGRFVDWNRAGDDLAPRTMQRAGYRREVSDASGAFIGVEYYVFIETFRSEICLGFDYRAVLRLLRERGHLICDKGRPFECRARLPGMGLVNVYRIGPGILAEDL